MTQQRNDESRARYQETGRDRGSLIGRAPLAPHCAQAAAMPSHAHRHTAALRTRALALLLFVAHAAAVGKQLACDRAPWSAMPFCDESLMLTARIADALGRMTLQEKIDTMSRPFESPFVPCHGTSGVASLGVGALVDYSECLHGVSTGCVTVAGAVLCPTLFPNAQMLGASFNRSLWRAVGSTIGDEMRALQNVQGRPSGFSCWSPNLNIARDPRWGRAQEVRRGAPGVASHPGASAFRCAWPPPRVLH